ncbi:acylphosphatase [Pseudodesulfovibrio nedwellii]|uniref:Acylphosphatase n=1 Tax=Pseudodesulfovibrio nedwellii TaxID=2973072 RepID=A0ABM8B1K4_9BACT|nr:acylphosphatase [Pseudodesulfovibrio nedwellii]BDQ37473.1 acylphosphatase [Pseudodesulfovibrio nedwellii]
MHQFHATIHGKVQGVWFRAWTRDTARELGVTGWVRNLPDGNVETLAQGNPELLSKFERDLWEGPPLARVTKINTTQSETDEIIPSFSIRR